MKIRVPQVDVRNWNAGEMKFDPFWADLLVPQKTKQRCKSLTK